MSVYVTIHAKKRLKQRVGLPKSACQRHAQKAFDNGRCHQDVRGSLKRYLDHLFLSHKTANEIRIYGQFIYLFANTNLMTVLHVPKKFI